MTQNITLALTVFCMTVTGCATAGSQSPAPRRRARAGRAHADPSQTCCVMEVPGAALDVNEIERGLALTFTTIDPESVQTMRAAVQRLALSFRNGEADHLHDRHGHDGHEHDGHGHDGHGAGRLQAHWHYGGFPQADVGVVDLADGARIELRAAGATPVEALRAEALAEAEMMRRGACPLLPTELAAHPPGNL